MKDEFDQMGYGILRSIQDDLPGLVSLLRSAVEEEAELYLPRAASGFKVGVVEATVQQLLHEISVDRSYKLRSPGNRTSSPPAAFYWGGTRYGWQVYFYHIHAVAVGCAERLRNRNAEAA